MARFTELSIINQCRGLMMGGMRHLHPPIEEPLTRAVIERLADHIARFSVGGMEKICQLSKRGESK